MSVCRFKSSTLVLLLCGIHVSADSMGRERRIRVPQKAMNVVTETFQSCEQKMAFGRGHEAG